MMGASAYLILRQINPTAQKTISAVAVSDDGRRRISMRKTALQDLVNTINLQYDLDYSRRTIDDSAYQSISHATDPASIAIHGTREKPESFRCQFVASAAHADQLRDFYLAWFAQRRWLYTLTLYLDHAELEFGDKVQLDAISGQIGTVTEAAITPGSEHACDSIDITVIT
jgi:hypothetical protein